ncbi:hypothetical protein GH714_008348 [Hevea brasiliensis]|uniref:Uncharacterized protein n=1 Tax=Hevea brasiliensis TaxID=3981 RepID=A0A6A6NG79_HEVBR|nr:hypothetical protein GH714_008348 [Hevea brasiliensis]
MERKQGFFSALKEEVVRGLSPCRSRAKSPVRSASPMSSLLRRRKGRRHHMAQPEPLIIARSGTLRPVEALSPLKEGPDQDVDGDSRIKGETSSAQYILQQYTAASGGQRAQNSILNAYAMGKVRMIASEFETANKVTGIGIPPKLLSLVHAGCNGKLVWRHTPWLGAHAAKGPVRPLRRALQGLDPRTTASMFTNARCIGEKKINGDDCFILKICADPATLKARRRTSRDHKAWRSVVTLFRFGDTAMSHTRTRMEEAWAIEEVAFNVPGLSMDCFIPPAELRFASMSETCELPQSQRVKPAVPAAAYRTKVAALDGSRDNIANNNVWKTDI